MAKSKPKKRRLTERQRWQALLKSIIRDLDAAKAEAKAEKKRKAKIRTVPARVNVAAWDNIYMQGRMNSAAGIR